MKAQIVPDTRGTSPAMTTWMGRNQRPLVSVSRSRRPELSSVQPVIDAQTKQVTRQRVRALRLKEVGGIIRWNRT